MSNSDEKVSGSVEAIALDFQQDLMSLIFRLVKNMLVTDKRARCTFAGSISTTLWKISVSPGSKKLLGTMNTPAYNNCPLAGGVGSARNSLCGLKLEKSKPAST